MKVIKYGKIRPRRISCGRCEVLLNYLPRDMIEDMREGAGVLEFVRYIECPVCEHKIYVEEW